MNSSSPVTTGAAAISGAMIGSVIVWICGVVHLAAPPPDVAGTLGALVLAGAHLAVNAISGRRADTPTPTPPATGASA